MADQLGVTDESQGAKGINHIVCEHLLRGGTVDLIYDKLRKLVENCQAPPPPALCELASIPDFELFITTTFDPLLVRALERTRHGSQARRPGTDCELSMATVIDFHYNDPRDLPAGSGARVYHLLGSLQTFSDFAVWEEDYLEFICGLLKHADVLKNLFRSPSDFVMELARQWRQRFADDGRDPLEKIPDQIPKDSVFISYSHRDLIAVREVVRGLRAAQIPVWLDKQRLQLGENYECQLSHAVKDASFFISIISTATETDSHRYVHQERVWAAQRHSEGYVFYLPVIIDDTSAVILEPQEFAKIHQHRLKDGRVSAEFALRLRHLIEEYRVSGRPRA